MTNNNQLLETTPTIPGQIYENLPIFLKDVTDQFNNQREKDIVLTGSLIILSGCFTAFRGKYYKDWVSPNLFSFIVAPPASGKSVMKYSKLLAKPIQDKMINNNKIQKREYEDQLKLWERQSKDEVIVSGRPQKPKFPLLFLPGNSSSAANYKLLEQNDGIGIICETEADTLTGAMKQQWGNYSHLFRSAFHHEPLDLSRATEDLHISIPNPCLSILLSGTPDQVPRLLLSAEDGLTSRFIFYCYSRELRWIDPTPCDDCLDITEYFVKKGDEVLRLRRLLESQSCTFDLTSQQFGILNANFRNKLKLIEIFEGTGAASAVLRLGLIAFRLAMVLTVIDMIDCSFPAQKFYCSDRDLQTALALTDTYFEHAMVMYSLLPKQNSITTNPSIRRFFNFLPIGQDFTRKTADEIAGSIGIKERSVYNYMKELIDKGLLKNIRFGVFLKPEIKVGS